MSKGRKDPSPARPARRRRPTIHVQRALWHFTCTPDGDRSRVYSEIYGYLEEPERSAFVGGVLRILKAIRTGAPRRTGRPS
jgi:hypothetical protein